MLLYQKRLQLCFLLANYDVEKDNLDKICGFFLIENNSFTNNAKVVDHQPAKQVSIVNFILQHFV